MNARCRILFILALLCMLVLTIVGAAQGQQGDNRTQESPVPDWSDRLDWVVDQVGKPNLTDAHLLRLREELERIRGEARKWAAAQEAELERVQQELETLGAPPGEGEKAEAAGVAAQRQEITARIAETAGPIKEADLVVERVGRLVAQIGELRRKRFADRVMARGPVPLSPEIWRLALPELSSIVRLIHKSAADFVASPQFQGNLKGSIYFVLLAVVVAVVLVWPVHRWLLRHYGRDPSVSRPSYIQAVRATLIVGATRALLPTLAVALIYIALTGQALLTDAAEEIAQAIFLGIVLFTWTIAFFRASLSPTLPDWRIVPIPTNFALGVRGIVIGLALVFAVDIVLSEVIVTYGARLAVSVLRDYALTVVVTILLLMLLLRQQMWTPKDDPSSKPRWRVIRIIIALGLVAIVVIGGFGYVALARLAITQVVLTGGLIFIALILHRLGREFIRHVVSLETWVGEWLRATLRMDDAGAARFEFWVGLAYDVVLALIGTVFGLFIWGADRQDISSWVYQALFGVKIGEITFSLVDLAVAVVLFAGLVTATRFLQRILAEQVLPQTQLDVGVRQSIRTGIGYVGIILAAVVGISALGLDLSNLAIVAGALSVGIGFGLQNVVNNFVSGLILLMERPVKVGDWVVVGDKQGYVKRIKVRATEIQTFDRASVFVPNSQLISDTVTNWTYADKLGRVIVPIGVAYGSDTQLVRQTLLDIGLSHPEVLKDPRPSAVFRGFGDSALNFELRCFLQDVERTIGVTSDLCFAIDDAFRKEGIEIPFPQQDVYVKQLAASAPQRSE